MSCEKRFCLGTCGDHTCASAICVNALAITSFVAVLASVMPVSSVRCNFAAAPRACLTVILAFSTAVCAADGVSCVCNCVVVVVRLILKRADVSVRLTTGGAFCFSVKLFCSSESATVVRFECVFLWRIRRYNLTMYTTHRFGERAHYLVRRDVWAAA